MIYAYLMRTSVADFLPQFERLGNEIAYAEQAGYRVSRWNYRDVAKMAYRFARELNARGVRKGDRIVLWGANSAAWVGAFLGCASRGVIVVPLDDSASPDFAERIIQQVDAKLVLCSREHANWFSENRGALRSAQVVLFEELRTVVGRHSGAELAAESVSEDTLQIVFTSGTTAEPKGVVISHANVLANIAPLEEQIRRYLKYAKIVHPIRFLNLLPLSHVFGQFLGMYLPQLLGGTVVFQNTLKPAEVIRTIQRERISVLVSVPRVLRSLKDKVERDVENAGQKQGLAQRFREMEGRHFLRRWWTFRGVHRQLGWKFWAFISGGAALDAETEEFWRRLGYAVIQGYGLTETTSLISVNHPFKTGRGSIGKVLAGREIKLAEDGEILVRGSGVASGYWSGGELRPVASEEGWYNTGDIGAVDSEGNLFFKGRKKDVIVTPAGMNIYPEDLESALRAHPEVKDCVVVPLAIGGNAEACAALILRGDESTPGVIVDQANKTLAEYQRIRRWVIWPDEDFPRTSTQKPRRMEIAAAASRMLGGTGQSVASEGLSQLIARYADTKTGSLTESAQLDADLNLSSLDRVELLSAIEERYQTDLSETRFSALKTVGDLERMLKGEVSVAAVYHYPPWVQRWPVTWIRFVVHYLLLRPAVFVLGWPRIQGRENLKGVKGPVLIISNHIGDVDVGFIQTALPARLRHKLATAAGGEALEALRTPAGSRNVFLKAFDRVEWFLGVSLLNLFPLPREAGFRQSFAYAGQSVDRGYSILVFPEGRHTTDGVMNPFRQGIGLLVKNLGIPVVPMRIDGLFKLKQAGRRMALPFRIRVKIGEPVSFPSNVTPEQIAAELQNRVAKL
jgi:long-chain acyl-CoA synthetase